MATIPSARSTTIGEQVPTRGADHVFAIVLIGILVAGRGLFQLLSVQELRLLLEPSAQVIAVVTNTSFEWSEQGISFHSLNIILDRSCSGFLFMLVLIVSSSWWTRSLYPDPRNYFLTLIAIILFGYGSTIISNVMRVMTTLMAATFDPTGWIARTALFHEFIGIIIQIFLLFLSHATIRYVISTRSEHRTA